MSSFTAFTFREGYPRRLPDRGTYWHMGKEVKSLAKRMKGWDHPELARPEPKQRPTRGERDIAREKAVTKRQDLRYRDRWGVDERGFRTVKAKKVKPARRTIAAG
jgi:hypothetical protein